MPAGAAAVELRVDPVFRALQSELHTLAHLVNAIVFRAFDGSLLTGAQLNADGTLRVDFDLPDVDNDRLRALEGEINAAAAADHEVTASRMDWGRGGRRAEALPLALGDAAEGCRRHGAYRADRGTWTGRRAAARTSGPPGGAGRSGIAKIENKGRHNRRMRIALGSE